MRASFGTLGRMLAVKMALFMFVQSAGSCILFENLVCISVDTRG